MKDKDNKKQANFPKQYPQFNSIVELMSPEEMGMGGSGGIQDSNILMNEFMVFKDMYSKKFMEYDDRKEIKGLAKYSIKSLFAGIVIAGVLNRGLTMIKFKKFDFMNLRFVFRFIIRSSIFTSFIFYFYTQSILALLDFRNKLNKKYIPRYIQFMNTGDPMMLNPKILEEPNTSQEEKESTLQFIKQMKSNLAAQGAGGAGDKKNKL
jgi:hypothetical protein